MLARVYGRGWCRVQAGSAMDPTVMEGTCDHRATKRACISHACRIHILQQ
jgi:hypothetical protein